MYYYNLQVLKTLVAELWFNCCTFSHFMSQLNSNPCNNRTQIKRKFRVVSFLLLGTSTVSLGHIPNFFNIKTTFFCQTLMFKRKIKFWTWWTEYYWQIKHSYSVAKYIIWSTMNLLFLLSQLHQCRHTYFKRYQ